MNELFDECTRLPTCRGYHASAVCERVQQERAVYATVTADGDPDAGMHIVMFRVLPLLDLVIRSDERPRCWLCGCLGSTCPIRHIVMNGTHTIQYCGLD